MLTRFFRSLAPLSLLTLVAAEPAPPADTPQQSPKEPPRESTVQTVPPNQAESILGRSVVDPAGKEIGRLIDVLVDGAGMPQAAVIDFGGFMGVGKRRIAVHWSTLQFSPSEKKNSIKLNMTPDQIKAAPEYVDKKPAQVVTPNDATPVAH
ncbi:MAG TPA: PRC-barrel domain-containing protein [Acetobacteraceae bacterium]|nr:PRC-barrel domain-containing protein [Acetobacteraceae bacterium]